MIRQIVMTGLILLMVVVLSACGDSEQSNESPAQGEVSSIGDEHGNDENNKGNDDDAVTASHDLDDKRKAEPRQVPTEFPLPILEGWVAGSPFEALTSGKKEGWSAEFLYEDDIEDNVKDYEQLLLEQGYQVDGHAFVEMSLGKGYTASGHISGILYSGTVVFDTNAEGQKRVWFNFTEKNED